MEAEQEQEAERVHVEMQQGVAAGNKEPQARPRASHHPAARGVLVKSRHCDITSH